MCIVITFYTLKNNNSSPDTHTHTTDHFKILARPKFTDLVKDY